MSQDSDDGNDLADCVSRKGGRARTEQRKGLGVGGTGSQPRNTGGVIKGVKKDGQKCEAGVGKDGRREKTIGPKFVARLNRWA